MSIEGVDYSANAIPPSLLRAAGKQFVSRYLAHDWRGITFSEVQDLRSGGIQIVANYEAEADRFLSGFAGGQWDARYAQGILEEVGLPPGQPIYFSCDFDASPGQQGVIDAYLKGAASVIGWQRVGVYAGYYVCLRCKQNGSAALFWQTYAWSGDLWLAEGHLQQYDIYGESVGSTDVDLDRAIVPHYGQASDYWATPTTQPPTTMPPKPKPPAYPTKRKPIAKAGTIRFAGLPSVTVTERADITAWCVHGTRLRAYPHRAAAAATNSEPTRRGRHYKLRYEYVDPSGEKWYAGAGGSFVLATAFSDTEPEPLGKG